MPTHLQLA